MPGLRLGNTWQALCLGKTMCGTSCTPTASMRMHAIPLPQRPRLCAAPIPMIIESVGLFCCCVRTMNNIFKKGDNKDPGNYRGITLLNMVGKLNTKVIDSRLSIVVR